MGDTRLSQMARVPLGLDREAVQTRSALGEGASRGFPKVKGHIEESRRGGGGVWGDEADEEPHGKNVSAEP